MNICLSPPGGKYVGLYIVHFRAKHTMEGLLRGKKLQNMAINEEKIFLSQDFLTLS